MSGGLLLILAYLALLLGAIVALFGDRLPKADQTIALFGAFCAGAAALLFALAPQTEAFGDKFVYGQIAWVASVCLCVLMCLWCMWISTRVRGYTRKAVGLAFFSLMGALMIASTREFVTLLVALELMAMPGYILIGYWTDRRAGLEAVLKYFLFSVVGTMIMAYGISFIYGASASTTYELIDLSHAGALGVMGVMMLLIGLFVKIAAAPFHFWAPDAYAGSTSWVLAFVGSVIKAGASLAFITIMWFLYDQVEALSVVLAIIAVISMVVGSFAALTQTHIRRILAYSGVVNAGYLLIALLAIEQVGERAIIAALIFTFTYALGVMGILFITASEGDRVKHLAGLSKRRPAAAWGLVILTLSMVGFPPLAGFFAKLFVFLAGLQSEFWIVVVLATIASAISAFYYLRLIKAAFFDKEEQPHELVKGYNLTKNWCADIAIVAVVLMVCVLIPLLALFVGGDVL